MARVQRGRVGPFEKECGGLLVVTGVCVCTVHTIGACHLNNFQGRRGKKGKDRKEILLSAGKKRLTLGPHTFFFECSLIVRAICSMGPWLQFSEK